MIYSKDCGNIELIYVNIVASNKKTETKCKINFNLSYMYKTSHFI